MRCQLKSNLRVVWWHLLGCAVLLSMTVLVLWGVLTQPWKKDLIFLILWDCFMLVLTVGSFINFLFKWQWVMVDEERVSVRCALFEIRSIPLAQVRRVFHAGKQPMLFLRYGAVSRDCLVIDTVTERKSDTITDGYCRRKQKYIILLDTPENRAALARFSLVVT